MEWVNKKGEIQQSIGSPVKGIDSLHDIEPYILATDFERHVSKPNIVIHRLEWTEAL